VTEVAQRRFIRSRERQHSLVSDYSRSVAQRISTHAAANGKPVRRHTLPMRALGRGPRTWESVGAIVRPSRQHRTAGVVPRSHNDDSVNYENGPNISYCLRAARLADSR
jgi:hypothetical protein